MIQKRNNALLLIALLCSSMMWACGLSPKRITNNTTAIFHAVDTTYLTFNEFMGYVKAYHPVAKQAELIINEGQAKVLRARGGFDPKIEIDYDRKEFKNTDYYNELNAAFKIPTWYGVEFKAGIENNQGDFLNPRDYTAASDLINAGVSVNLGQGLLINDRMATLKKAKIYRNQSLVERDLLVNDILHRAAVAYFNWWQAHQEYVIYDDFLNNAQVRFNAIKKAAQLGDKAVIDTVEASIAVQNRKLNREQARLHSLKKRLELANFLWVQEVPVELQEQVVPQENLLEDIDTTLEIFGFQLNDFNIENHPKLQTLSFKIDQLEVDKRLKANKLLPVVSLDYNLLTPQWQQSNTYRISDYKAGLRFAFPLFLRKERGELRLAKIKIADTDYERNATQLEIKNKVTAIFNELDSYQLQTDMITSIVTASQRMLTAEERKFELGDSSLFLINSREIKLIDSKLKEIKTFYKLFETKARLFKSLAIMPQNM